MNRSTLSPRRLLDQMAPAAKTRFASEAAWAQASGLPPETLSRLKGRASCDLATLAALAAAAGYTLVAVPDPTPASESGPFDRSREEALLELCASGSTDPDAWRAHGSGFFMGGLAVMLAGARGFDRSRYLRLAEALHPGISTPEAFGLWLRQSPLRPARFLPMAARRRAA
jgi:hypothetical protein